MRNVLIPVETGWKSQGACGQGGQWNREVDCLDFQMVCGGDNHPEVQFGVVCSGNSPPSPASPCATVLASTWSICFFQRQLLMLMPPQDPWPQPQVSRDGVCSQPYLTWHGGPWGPFQHFQILDSNPFLLVWSFSLENSEQ